MKHLFFQQVQRNGGEDSIFGYTSNSDHDIAVYQENMSQDQSLIRFPKGPYPSFSSVYERWGEESNFVALWQLTNNSPF